LIWYSRVGAYCRAEFSLLNKGLIVTKRWARISNVSLMPLWFDLINHQVIGDQKPKLPFWSIRVHSLSLVCNSFCYSILSFLCSVLWPIVCLFPIILHVLRFTVYDKPLGISKQSSYEETILKMLRTLSFGDQIFVLI
jgi:hypothetical protein